MSSLGSFAALLVVALGYGTIVPLAPTLLQRSMGPMSVEALSLHTGALSAAYLLAFAALAPLWGRAVDVRSRRAIAAGGLVGFAVSFAVIAAIERVDVLYAALALAGACAAAVVPAVQVQVARVEGDLARARVLAALGAASFAGWFLGPPLASWSIARVTVAGVPADRFSLGVVALLGLAAATLTHFPARLGLFEEKSTAAPEPPTALGRDAWTFGLLAMAVTFGIGGFEVSLVLWVVQVLRLDASLVSRMLVECTIVMMMVQALIFLLPAARPRWKPSAAGVAFVAMAGAIAAVPLAGGGWIGFAAVAVIAITATLLQTMISLGTVASARSRAGAALGLQLSLSSVGQGVGSFTAGALFSASGGGFFVSAALVAAMGAWAFTLRE